MVLNINYEINNLIIKAAYLLNKGGSLYRISFRAVKKYDIFKERCIVVLSKELG